MEKTFYTTEEAFPTVLRRSEVIGVEILEISPLENALNEVEEKTKELAALNLKYQAVAKTTQLVSTNALAMSLNSAVDAPLNTGVASYRQTFFDPDYIARYPERAEMVYKLRVAIDEQVSDMMTCGDLHIFTKKIGPSHRQLSQAARAPMSAGVYSVSRNFGKIL